MRVHEHVHKHVYAHVYVCSGARCEVIASLGGTRAEPGGCAHVGQLWGQLQRTWLMQPHSTNVSGSPATGEPQPAKHGLKYVTPSEPHTGKYVLTVLHEQLVLHSAKRSATPVDCDGYLQRQRTATGVQRSHSKKRGAHDQVGAHPLQACTNR